MQGGASPRDVIPREPLDRRPRLFFAADWPLGPRVKRDDVKPSASSSCSFSAKGRDARESRSSTIAEIAAVYGTESKPLRNRASVAVPVEGIRHHLVNLPLSGASGSIAVSVHVPAKGVPANAALID